MQELKGKVDNIEKMNSHFTGIGKKFEEVDELRNHANKEMRERLDYVTLKIAENEKDIMFIRYNE